MLFIKHLNFKIVSLIKYKNIPHVQNKTVQEECFYGGY